MKEPAFDLIIIGAGLSGLALAYFLKNHNLKIKILEGRLDVGGRIKTTSDHGTTLEMGATWLHPNHTELQKLIQDLGLEFFEQELGVTAFYEASPEVPYQLVHLPTNQEPSYRIKGGSYSLIQTLVDKIGDNKIVLNRTVNSIEEVGKHLLVKTNSDHYTAKKVVSTLPPNLFQKIVKTTPALPKEFSEICLKTHTWMGESIKFGLVYDSAFWKKQGISGTVFSNAGPITEMYDHSNFEESKFALKGFLSRACVSLTRKERLELILNQIEKYYGLQVRNFSDYQELLWEREPLTFTPYLENIFPHQNNGNKAFKEIYLNNKLIISGTETSAIFAGYMEGAIRSSIWTAHKISHMLGS